jgi:hypothetical protein
MITIKNRGEELTSAELQEIYNNLFISEHARERLRERVPVNIKQLFESPLVAYFNTDGSVNVALDEYNYLVVQYCEHFKNWKVVTWKEKSWNSKTVFDKQRMAKAGYGRKVKNEDKICVSKA